MVEVSLETDQVEEALEAPLVRSLLESISDGVIVVDALERRILAINPVARQLLAYDDKQIMGCQCRRIVNTQTCEDSCPLESILAGEHPRQVADMYFWSRNRRAVLRAQTRMILLRGSQGQPLAAIEIFGGLDEVEQARKRLGRRALHQIIGESQAMQALFESIERIAPHDVPVLITGETGTGKERVADALHLLSCRADAPFIKVNCAALSPSLVESELFGHRKGAYTGARDDRAGRFEAADGGTLLLDEVGELSPEIQAKLLRVLQEGEVQRVGDDRPRYVNVRILAATNRDLRQDVRQGRFRADLYYRLLGAEVPIPALRDRAGDIPLLAEHFLQRYCEKQRRPDEPMLQMRFAEQAIAELERRRWEGNVRELERVVQLAAIRAWGKDTIRAEHLRDPIELHQTEPQQPTAPAAEPARADRLQTLCLEDLERMAIDEAMRSCEGNITHAARELGIDRSTLWRKLKRLEALEG